MYAIFFYFSKTENVGKERERSKDGVQGQADTRATSCKEKLDTQTNLGKLETLLVINTEKNLN